MAWIQKKCCFSLWDSFCSLWKILNLHKCICICLHERENRQARKPVIVYTSTGTALERGDLRCHLFKCLWGNLMCVCCFFKVKIKLHNFKSDDFLMTFKMRIKFKSSVRWRFKTHETVRNREFHFTLCWPERNSCLCFSLMFCPQECCLASYTNKPQPPTPSVRAAGLFFSFFWMGRRCTYSFIYRYPRTKIMSAEQFHIRQRDKPETAFQCSSPKI